MSKPATSDDLFLFFIILLVVVCSGQCGLNGRLDKIESHIEAIQKAHPSIEQAGSRESGWESSEPFTGHKVDSSRKPVTDSRSER